MKLKDYNNYLNENMEVDEIEKRKAEALASHMRLYLSKEFATILKRIDDKDGIANDLLTLSKKPIQFDISFIDKSDKNDTITFLQTNRAKRIEKEKNIDLSKSRNDYTSEIWTTPLRQPTGIGRFVKKIFEDKYSAKQIEDFVNEYKAKYEEKNEKMKIVYGEDIRYWYDQSRYAPGGGPLNGSCMRHKEKSPFLEIYVDNPESIGMLILLDDNQKLLGRALVWFNLIKEPKRTFMDRIYTANDHDVNTFKDYAKKNGWLYKNKQVFNDATYIDSRDDSKHTLTLSARLKAKDYKYYPFLDTLSVFTPETGRISSNQGKYVGRKRLRLQNQDGSYQNVPDR